MMDYNHAVPSRITPLTRPLMVRQPYSEAVKSDREERFPLSPEGRRPRREVEPSLMVKKDGLILEKNYTHTRVYFIYSRNYNKTKNTIPIRI